MAGSTSCTRATIAAGVRLAFLLTGDHTHAEDLAWTPDGVERT